MGWLRRGGGGEGGSGGSKGEVGLDLGVLLVVDTKGKRMFRKVVFQERVVVVTVVVVVVVTGGYTVVIVGIGVGGLLKGEY